MKSKREDETADLLDQTNDGIPIFLTGSSSLNKPKYPYYQFKEEGIKIDYRHYDWRGEWVRGDTGKQGIVFSSHVHNEFMYLTAQDCFQFFICQNSQKYVHLESMWRRFYKQGCGCKK